MGVAVASSTAMFIRKRAVGGDCVLRLRSYPAGVDARAAGEPRPEERHRRAGLQRRRSAPTAIGTAIKRPSSRDIEQFLSVGPPSRLAPARRRSPATGRRAPETVGRKSALAWIRSTDTPPTARRARIALPSRRRACRMTGTGLRSPAIGSGPEVQPCLRMPSPVEQPLPIRRPAQRHLGFRRRQAAVDRRQRHLPLSRTGPEGRCAMM